MHTTGATTVTTARTDTKPCTELRGKSTTAPSPKASSSATWTATATTTTSQTSSSYPIARPMLPPQAKPNPLASSATVRPELAASATATTNSFGHGRKAAGKRSSADVPKQAKNTNPLQQDKWVSGFYTEISTHPIVYPYYLIYNDPVLHPLFSGVFPAFPIFDDDRRSSTDVLRPTTSTTPTAPTAAIPATLSPQQPQYQQPYPQQSYDGQQPVQQVPLMPLKPKRPRWMLYAGLAFLALCGVCGLIGTIGALVKPTTNTNSTTRSGTVGTVPTVQVVDNVKPTAMPTERIIPATAAASAIKQPTQVPTPVIDKSATQAAATNATSTAVQIAQPAPPTTEPATPSQGTTVEITSPPGTVNAGSNASVSIHTSPNAACSIDVEYKNGPSKAQGLDPKSADAKGNASWTWKVASTTTLGSWPVYITCNRVTVTTHVIVR